MKNPFKYMSALVAVLMTVCLLAAPAGAALPALSGSKTFMPFPGIEVRSVTELTSNGWLRYAVIIADTRTGEVYVGPFTGSSSIDNPYSVEDTLASKGLVAAVNGDFFDTESGIPLSMVVSEGILMRSPRKDPDFATLCIPVASSGYIESFTWSSNLLMPDGSKIVISSYNELSVGSSEAVMYNALRSDRKYPPSATVALIGAGSVIAVFDTGATGKPLNSASLSLPFEYEVVATGAKAQALKALNIGDEVGLEFNLFPPYPMEAAFSGKPVLVQDGSKKTGLAKFTSISGALRAPRTMAGIGWDGRLYLVAVEGRSVDSRGLTLDEAADLMLELGCRDAVNLDGGGSTQAAVSDGSYPVRLIGPSGEPRKVSYSVGVAARDGSAARSYPPLMAQPLYGFPFEIPAHETPREQGNAASSLLGELPVVTVGTLLYFPTEEGAIEQLEIIAGSAERNGFGGISVVSDGYLEISALTNGVQTHYRMLVTGSVASALIEKGDMTEGGLSLKVSSYDSHGRYIPLPASGLSFSLVVDGKSFDLKGPFIPSSLLEGIDGTVSVVASSDGKVISAMHLETEMERIGASRVLISGFEDASAWSSSGAPSSSLIGFEGSAGQSGMGFILTYDFSGSGVRAAYLKPAERILIPIGYEALSIMADGSAAGAHWLRANVRDSNDARYFLDFGRLDRMGWREYTAQLPEVSGPLYLEQVYLVEFKDDLASSGYVRLDELAAFTNKFPASAIAKYLPSITHSISYAMADAAVMSMEASLVLQYGVSAVPGMAKVLRLDATGGKAFANGIGQWQRLFAACTEPAGKGILLIEVRGSASGAKEGQTPLMQLKDENERQLLIAAAQRAAFMGYSQVLVVEFGSSEPLFAQGEGVTYLSIP